MARNTAQQVKLLAANCCHLMTSVPSWDLHVRRKDSIPERCSLVPTSTLYHIKHSIKINVIYLSQDFWMPMDVQLFQDILFQVLYFTK